MDVWFELGGQSQSQKFHQREHVLLRDLPLLTATDLIQLVLIPSSFNQVLKQTPFQPFTSPIYNIA